MSTHYIAVLQDSLGRRADIPLITHFHLYLVASRHSATVQNERTVRSYFIG
jgi:hypothetical protein